MFVYVLFIPIFANWVEKKFKKMKKYCVFYIHNLKIIKLAS